MSTNDLLKVRPYRPSDKNFILATWLKGLKYGNDWFNLIPPQIYFKVYQALLAALLDSSDCEVKISCLKDDEDVILGYAVMNKGETALHWSFVKSAWRGVGVMKSLVPPTICAVTHVTKVGLSLLKKHPNVVFNPFILTLGEK